VFLVILQLKRGGGYKGERLLPYNHEGRRGKGPTIRNLHEKRGVGYKPGGPIPAAMYPSGRERKGSHLTKAHQKKEREKRERKVICIFQDGEDLACTGRRKHRFVA